MSKTSNTIWTINQELSIVYGKRTNDRVRDYAINNHDAYSFCIISNFDNHIIYKINIPFISSIEM